MSPHSTEQSTWSSPAWLWLLLAICLIGWRVSVRTDQYRPTIACSTHQAQVAFYDANERNIASFVAARSESRLIAEQPDSLFPAVAFEKPAPPLRRVQREPEPTLPPIYVDSVSLFPNPPPISIL